MEIFSAENEIQMPSLQIVSPTEKLRVVVLGSGALGMSLLRGVGDASEHAHLVGFLPVCKIPRYFLLENHPKEKELLQFARDRGLGILDCPGVNSIGFRQELDRLRPHIVLVGGWPEILKESVLNSGHTTFINCHGSDLPKYRGACPHLASIFFGDSETAITFHLIDAGIDTGDILLQEKVLIKEKETALALSDRMAGLSEHVVANLLRAIVSGRAIPRRQLGQSSYVPSADPQWGWIQWHSSPGSIDRTMRALEGYLPLFTTLNGTVIGFENGRLVTSQRDFCEKAASESRSDKSRVPPGTVISDDRDKLTVATRDPGFHVELKKPVILPSTQNAQMSLRIKPGDQFISRKCASILKAA